MFQHPSNPQDNLQVTPTPPPKWTPPATSSPTCPPPAESLALLLGCAQLSIFGLAGLADPDGWAAGYGLPLSSSKAPDTSDRNEQIQVQRALVTATAARNITNGLLIFGLGAYLRDRKALGMAITCNVVTTVADFLIVRWFGVSEQAPSHIIGVVNSTAIGLALLKWSRDDPWW